MDPFRSFDNYIQAIPLNQDIVLNHVIEKFFPNFGNNRQASAHNNYLAIIEATFKLSDEAGFSNMSIRDLVKETGFSIGRLYHYIESKDTLEKIIVEGLFFICDKALNSLKNTEVGYEEQFRRIIKGHVFLADAFRPWFHFVFMELRSLKPENIEIANELQTRYLKILSKRLDNNFMLASHIGVCLQDRYLKDWKHEGVSVDDYADHMLMIGYIYKENASRLGDSNLHKDETKAPEYMKKALAIKSN